MHHDFKYSVSFNAAYAHPIEHLFVARLTFLACPMILGSKMHFSTMRVAGLCFLIDSLDIHSGYHFPWVFTSNLPFAGGAEYHDYHHSANFGTYGADLTVWDCVFNTNKAFYSNITAEAEEE